jgi:hypothetical protein
MGRDKECARTLEQVRNLARNDPDVLYNLGLAYEEASERSGGKVPAREASALYRRVLELAPTYRAARDRLKAME